jgi:hypothetical protein
MMGEEGLVNAQEQPAGRSRRSMNRIVNRNLDVRPQKAGHGRTGCVGVIPSRLHLIKRTVAALIDLGVWIVLLFSTAE